LPQAEEQFVQAAKDFALDMLEVYVQQLSENLAADRQGRRKAGLVLGRKKDKRKVLTELGGFLFQRDHYWNKHKQCYR
jgi:hypothetical protein